MYPKPWIFYSANDYVLYLLITLQALQDKVYFYVVIHFVFLCTLYFVRDVCVCCVLDKYFFGSDTIILYLFFLMIC